MSDLDMTVTITRDALGLAPLDINDGLVYAASLQFLGSVVAWNRNQVTSYQMDGAVTVNRQKTMVQEPVAFEVHGRTPLSPALSNIQLKANFDEITEAFCQDNFVLTVNIEGAIYAYSGEASDYQITWLGNRFMAKQGLITFTMPRQPTALAGVV